MKKAVWYLCLVSVATFFISSRVLASSLYTISGLSGGTEIDGYYTSPPTLNVQLNPSYPEPCTAQGGTVPGNGNLTVLLASNTGSLNGSYTWEMLEDTVSHALLVTKDGNWHDGNIIDACNWNGPNPNWVIVWSQSIQYDESNPIISIASPSNNTDFASSAGQITVSGTVGDSGSGIKSVTVNRVNADVIGTTFTASININFGLNTITATATSNVGSTATSQQINVFRYENASSGGTMSSSGTTSGQGSGGTSIGTTTGTKTPVKPSTTVSTPVKAGVGASAVAGAGLATASYLGYVPYKKIGLLIAKLIGK